MKTRSVMQCMMCLFIMGTVLISSCKKSNDPKPNPSANTDNISMGAAADSAINVLTNDTYSGNATVTVNANSAYGTVVVNANKTITYTPKLDFFGTATFTYSLQDDNGTSSGSIVITVGTAAQIKTYNTISAFVSADLLWMYSIDGDTARVYQNIYAQEQIDYGAFSQNKLYISSAGALPVTGDYTYSIVSDGTIYTHDNANNPVFLTIGDTVTASAMKHDGSGYMTVTGYSVIYNGHTYVYTTAVL